MHAAFQHLADDRYKPGYYAYEWSMLIARDLLSGFDQANLMASGPARHFHNFILSPGGSCDGDDLVDAFLGRAVSSAAHDRWLTGASGQPVT